MRRLESEGLLVCDTHRGFTVVAPDVGRLEENFQIRAALESLGASLAAPKIDPRGLDRLRELNGQMRALPIQRGSSRKARTTGIPVSA